MLWTLTSAFAHSSTSLFVYSEANLRQFLIICSRNGNWSQSIGFLRIEDGWADRKWVCLGSLTFIPGSTFRTTDTLMRVATFNSRCPIMQVSLFRKLFQKQFPMNKILKAKKSLSWKIRKASAPLWFSKTTSTKHHDNKNAKYWRCNIRKCPASLAISSDNMFQVLVEKPDHIEKLSLSNMEIEVLGAIEKMEERCKTTNIPVQTIFRQV